MFGDFKYYELTHEDGSTRVVYTDFKPYLGRMFNPLTGEYYGPVVVSVQEMTEQEIQEKYPNDLKTVATWFGFKDRDWNGQTAWLVKGKPTNISGSILNKHSKKKASNDRYEVWEVDAPYKIRLPNGTYIWGNERDENFDLLLLDKVEQKVYFASLPVEDAPINSIKQWLGSHSF